MCKDKNFSTKTLSLQIFIIYNNTNEEFRYNLHIY